MRPGTILGGMKTEAAEAKHSIMLGMNVCRKWCPKGLLNAKTVAANVPFTNHEKYCSTHYMSGLLKNYIWVLYLPKVPLRGGNGKGVKIGFGYIGMTLQPLTNIFVFSNLLVVNVHLSEVSLISM